MVRDATALNPPKESRGASWIPAAAWHVERAPYTGGLEQGGPTLPCTPSLNPHPRTRLSVFGSVGRGDSSRALEQWGRRGARAKSFQVAARSAAAGDPTCARLPARLRLPLAPHPGPGRASPEPTCWAGHPKAHGFLNEP